MPQLTIPKERCTLAELEEAIREVKKEATNNTKTHARRKISKLTTAEHPKIVRAIAHLWLAEYGRKDDIRARIAHFEAGVGRIIEFRAGSKAEPGCDERLYMVYREAMNLMGRLRMQEEALARYKAAGFARAERGRKVEGVDQALEGKARAPTEAGDGAEGEGGWVVLSGVFGARVEASELGDEFVLVD